MSYKILNYISFDNNDDFVNWQKIKKREIVSVSPIYNSFGGEAKEEDIEVRASIGCLVQYWDGEHYIKSEVEG